MNAEKSLLAGWEHDRVFLGCSPIAEQREAYWKDRERQAVTIRDLRTAAVKRLWDQYNGSNAPLGYDGETIHAELNRRGEGLYCAV